MRSCPREILRRRPGLSAIVLLGGGIAYWMACQPGIYARGYPPIDPFWQFMPWLWPIPALVSAIFENDRRIRNRQLLVYSLAVGFVMGGVLGGGAVPRRVSIMDMLAGALIAGPVTFCIAWILERIAQRALGLLREFELTDKCRKCNYCIRYLSDARCPECGEPFDARWTDPGFAPPPVTTQPWKTRILAVLLVAVGAMTPFGFDAVSLDSAVADGRAAAERDWAAGNSILYIRRQECYWLPEGTYDVDTGMLVRSIHGGRDREAFQEAYRDVVRQKLDKQGPPKRKPGVLNREEIKSLLNSSRFSDVPEFPFRLNEQVTVNRDARYTSISRRWQDGCGSFSTSNTSGPVRYAGPDDANGIAFLLIDDALLMSFTPAGELLQQVEVENGEVVDPRRASQPDGG